MTVVIIGAGPTGLTAATLLAQHGVECLVLERWDSVYPQPRAVHLDDEVYRILARLGVADEFAAISWPCLGLRLLDPAHQVLAEFQRGTEPGPHGFPEANMFDQPDLERVLRANLRRFDHATVRGNVEVTALTQDAGHVRVDITDRGTGDQETIHAEYVLGCDGANSLTRDAIGATLRDLGLEQRWLVVDVATTADIDQWEGVHQLCDPARPGTYMRIGKTRYRWEFRLRPDETADDFSDPARLHPLISPWTGDVPVAELEIVRVAEYTFRARIADRWRDRRILILGDAAHLTPPFIGQGMGAGLRDAHNLAWKLAAVLDGSLPESVLDTYQTERAPHARSIIRLATLIGAAMTAGGRMGVLLRKLIAPRLHLIPGVRARVLSSQTPPLSRSALVHRTPWSLAGALCPNVVLADGRRFDEAADGRLVLVGQSADAAISAEPGTELHRWLRAGRARSAFVRPDGTVAWAGRDVRTAPALLR
ncbi:MAG TPA: bifunctional 3-(3-hydroxy-phenyl)propionate/3-hydroxycinnamic acid hydroxylase [Actinokineospora sp.]|nr:bifunctional 3-(3-hydroxy-phenyl)propionate/3-hydroxycinnamic acid hydroxylase [Actinokineospora sp.]